MKPWRAVAMLLGFAPIAFAVAADRVDLVVFVGQLQSVRELPDECAPAEKCSAFDGGYELTYEVLETVVGRPASSTMTVSTYAHNGLQSFAYYPQALLFVYQSEKGNVTARHLGFPVAETEQGEWAYCGDPYEKEMAESLKKFRRITFVKPVSLSPLSEKPREDAAHADPLGDMRPGITRCTRAVAAKELAAYATASAEPGYRRVWLWE